MRFSSGLFYRGDKRHQWQHISTKTEILESNFLLKIETSEKQKKNVRGFFLYEINKKLVDDFLFSLDERLFNSIFLTAIGLSASITY